MGLPKDSGLDLKSKWPSGKYNKISDVPGVSVAHVTLKGREINTGVTAILPHQGDLFHDKVAAGAQVLNGFGKSLGIVQIQELGTIETPIIMTNTFAVGAADSALVKYMLRRNDDIGINTGTVNAVVTECNDGSLNDIRGMHVKERDVMWALNKAAGAGPDFDEGAVGGGTGMCCLGFKGGIGSASRIVEYDGRKYNVGAIVMANFGAAGKLRAGGRFLGEELKAKVDARAAAEGAAAEDQADKARDKGSIIMVVATDLPMTSRQLSRVCRRCPVALGRTGSIMGDGSGDIAIAFSTGNREPHYPDRRILDIRMVHDSTIDDVFEAAIEAVEESVLSALYHAETTRGVRGSIRYGLRDFL